MILLPRCSRERRRVERLRSKRRDKGIISPSPDKVYYVKMKNHHLHNIHSKLELEPHTKPTSEPGPSIKSLYVKMGNRYLHNIHSKLELEPHTKSTSELKQISKRRIYHSFTSIPAHQPSALCLRHCDESSKTQSLCFTRFCHSERLYSLLSCEESVNPIYTSTCNPQPATRNYKLNEVQQYLCFFSSFTQAHCTWHMAQG